MTKISRHVAVIVFAFSCGYFYRNYRLNLNTVTLHDVTIVDQVNKARWIITTPEGKWDLKICPTYLPDWKIGNRFSMVKYEDMGSCKSLAPNSGMGFHRDKLKTIFSSALKESEL